MTHTDFKLEEFFPYLTRNFNAAVSQAISQVYRARYDMAPAEWRCMAILGPSEALSARLIGSQSSMDKVAVSRAVARLMDRGWVEARADSKDGRSKLLSLTPAGRQVFVDLLPEIRAAEEQLLQGLDDQDRAALLRIMAHIKNNVAAEDG